MFGKAVIVLSLIVLAVLSAPEQDRVYFLVPQYAGRWYSGYLNVGKGEFHYVFFESIRNTDNDPVVLWLNGGPGCSSMIGMFYINGPFFFKPNTSNILLNDFNWNKEANLLYIESPQGVGFSTGPDDVILNDATVANYNLNALLAFFQKFPNLKKNDFYITGQSYAGVYIPYLANEIIKYNKLPSSKETIIRLKGIMMGNPCTDPNQCAVPGNHGMSLYQYEFLFKRNFYTEKQYNDLRTACYFGDYHGPQCSSIRESLDNAFAFTKTNINNIYDVCYLRTGNQKKELMESGRYRPGGANSINCDDAVGILEYLNEFDIAEHLHVHHIVFEECNSRVEERYEMFKNASSWLYPILMSENIRIWVYSGDLDANVPITGTLDWITKLKESHGMPVIEPWREWWVPGLHKHEDQMGGMTWRLRGLTFATIKGAGHMAPKDRRKEGFILISSFLSGDPLPYKNQEE